MRCTRTYNKERLESSKVYYKSIKNLRKKFSCQLFFDMANYEVEGEELKDKSRCAHLRAKLKLCLLNTDCCRIQRRTPLDCLKTRDASVPDECYQLRTTLFECKHSILDGRRRFRGPKGY